MLCADHVSRLPSVVPSPGLTPILPDPTLNTLPNRLGLPICSKVSLVQLGWLSYDFHPFRSVALRYDQRKNTTRATAAVRRREIRPIQCSTRPMLAHRK